MDLRDQIARQERLLKQGETSGKRERDLEHSNDLVTELEGKLEQLRHEAEMSQAKFERLLKRKEDEVQQYRVRHRIGSERN